MLKRLESLTNTHLHRIPARHETPYATHVPILAVAPILKPVRRVLELGSGLYSTPLFLNQQIYPDLVALDSYENNQQWGERILQQLRGDSRLSLNLVEQSVALVVKDLNLESYDLILIDDSVLAAEREQTIQTVNNKHPANALVVIHDFEWAPYRRMARGFTQVYRVTALNPNVGLAWNGSELSLMTMRRLNRWVRQNLEQIPVHAPEAWAQAWRKNGG